MTTSASSRLTYAMLRSRRLQPIGTETFFLDSLRRRVRGSAAIDDSGNLRLNICPDYQRGRVWTDQQASRFIGFLAEGGEAPVLFIQRWRHDPTDELIDGLQRVTALLRFGDDEIPMETPRGEVAYLRDFSEADQRILGGPAGLKITAQYVECPTRADVLALYIRLNRGGTPHSDAEIERVERLLQAEVAP